MTKRPSFAVPVAIACASVWLLSLVHPLAGRAGPSPRVEVSERVAVSAPGHAMSEFGVATNPRDPRHILVGAMDWHDGNGATPGLATFHSRDGGRTWAQGGAVPRLDGPFWLVDPAVTIDLKGRGHLAGFGVGHGLEPNVQHSVSPDGGATWEPAAPVPMREGATTVDKESIYAARDGRLHMCVNEYGGGNDDLVVAHSDDGGKSWSEPRPLLPQADYGNCNGIVEGPRGELYMSWWAVGGHFAPWGVGTLASFDGGDTWDRVGVVDDAVNFTPQGLPLNSEIPFPNPPAAIAVSGRTGHVFMARAEWDDTTEHFEARLARSDDEGATYEDLSLPDVRAASCDGCEVIKTSVAVSGRGDLGYAITLTDATGLSRETWLAVSRDEGATWLEPSLVASTGPAQSWADPRTWMPGVDATRRFAEWYAATPQAAPQASSPLLARYGQGRGHLRYGGDYWGMASRRRGFVTFWIDNFEGGVPQIWASVVTIRG